MVATKPVTAEGLLAMGRDEQNFELIDGELYEVSPTWMEPAAITQYLGATLVAYVKPRKLGLVLSPEGGWIVSRDPDSVLAPDIGFIRRERLSQPGYVAGFVPVPPDLAVEVVSPSDRDSKVLRKVSLYAQADVPLIWVVYPQKRVVTVFRLGEPPVTLREGEVLSGEDVVPGFAIPIEEIFADPLA